MMTVKEYVEDKVKSYTRLAERCKREAEASDDIVVRAGYSARATSGRCAPEKWTTCGRCCKRNLGDHVCLTLSSMSCGTPCMTQKKKSLPVRQHGQAQRVMSLAAHHHKNSTKQEVLQVALLRIYDVGQEPPALVLQQQFPVASDAVAIADELAKRKPEQLYRAFDADMNVVYAR